ncbi:hypothetical protein, variant 2 [Cryptococcus amylolentus CBS 6039]|uniref:Uncharacterized protein n=2 Tax=Cryptococcus amylolentus TaxID=104669 RepID=A0A1E3HEH4_9TREE|nr:hypothetical protein L202_06916 [Cryptococcus amylolentus CBS 6039]XP_018990327.1 hypothetical protein, variant 1 [Cryptococcus amylolentus CBS 6039]XP_018990328.1 hypothetical protein, variant 2 [Cryptococcus amylolentus CBS 6039]ODO01520.1 hypothetical protein I350_06340 [Cryptococcus amylolentus CBS 6273]ODN74545.1 hypothetical protein L202_06916 [Cryptococcus amylolentus CBS 6039]ODN74546.1 hypothetical protein, variant 1 [Cryptococcus amylolentus CBS 6039]ODN74547.1 hypothetical prote
MSSTPNRQHDSSWFDDDSSSLQGESDEHDEESDQVGDIHETIERTSLIVNPNDNSWFEDGSSSLQENDQHDLTSAPTSSHPNDNSWFNDGSSSLQEEIDQHALTSAPTDSQAAAPSVITGRIEKYIDHFRNATNNDQRVDALHGLSHTGSVGAAFRSYYAYEAQTFVHQLSRSRQEFTSFLSRSRRTIPRRPVPLPADMHTGDPADDALLVSWWDRKQASDVQPSWVIQADERLVLEEEVNKHFWNDVNDTRVGDAVTEILSQAWVKDVDVEGVGIEKGPL